jgi:hypothetical protein
MVRHPSSMVRHPNIRRANIRHPSIRSGALRALRALLPVALLVGAGCEESVTAPDVVGEWGGLHISLLLTESGGTLEYDCAHGTMGAGWTISSEGRLEATGEYVQEHGGPVREGEETDPEPARYTGMLRGDNLTLTVTLTDSGQVLGPFELRRGEAGWVFKCL